MVIPRSPDSYDLGECQCLHELCTRRQIYFDFDLTTSPSYQFNSLNFDFKKLSVISPLDHLNHYKRGTKVSSVCLLDPVPHTTSWPGSDIQYNYVNLSNRNISYSIVLEDAL